MHKRNNNNKVIIILCLLAIVVSLSIGFSVFSNNLIIKQGATVTPDPSDFKVLFSSSKDSLQTTAIKPSSGNAMESSSSATINNNDPTHPKITGIKATFTKPNSSVGYTFYVRNEGNYVAYLKSVKIGNASNVSAKKKCTAKQGTSQTLVDEACGKISLAISLGDDMTNSNPLYDLHTTKDNITGHPLAKNASEKIHVWIGYSYNNPNGPVADGDFDVEFGDLTLTYSSSDS